MLFGHLILVAGSFSLLSTRWRLGLSGVVLKVSQVVTEATGSALALWKLGRYLALQLDVVACFAYFEQLGAAILKPKPMVFLKNQPIWKPGPHSFLWMLCSPLLWELCSPSGASPTSSPKHVSPPQRTGWVVPKGWDLVSQDLSLCLGAPWPGWSFMNLSFGSHGLTLFGAWVLRSAQRHPVPIPGACECGAS